jgi:FAD/FMN-containing dehydrogenase/Fe-S oxidoreductase
VVTAREEVVDALRRAGVAEVDDSTLTRAMYSSDASLYRVTPAAVVRPRDVDEVAAVLDVCRTLGVPLTSRGAGTSIAGNAVGTGVVLDFSRHLNRVLAVDREARTATVEPGVVQAQLQRAAAPHGLRFGPDPSTHNRATLGGMIGNNACGSRALGYGRTADNVVGLQLLTGTGQRLDVGAEAGRSASSAGLLVDLEALVARELATIRTELGRFSRQVSGYSLEHLLPERSFDVARALVGSEGTLGVVLGATVRLVAEPAHRGLVVLGYPDMATAADAVPAVLPHRPTACEGIDGRILDVVRARRGPGAVPPMPRGSGWLLVEVTGRSPSEVADTARAVVADAAALDALVVTDPRVAAGLWRIREDGAGLAGRTTAGAPAHSGWEDAAVPPAVLGAYLRDFERLLVDHRLAGVPYGHFGDGCVHIRIDFPFEAPSGVLVDPRPVDADLRAVQVRPLREGLALGYHHDGGDFSAAVHRCTGVGKCLADTGADGGVMCPSFLATREEKDSTRGRARVLQEMVNGTTVTGGWRSPEVRAALDLCLACKGCSSDCPTGVDMASYKAEVLHQSYRGRLRPRSHYALGWLPRWARLASRAPRLANAVLDRPALAGLARWAAGVDARRGLPQFAQETFHRWFARRSAAPMSTDRPPVVLFVDSFTEHFRPEVGIAAVRVLEDAGYAVRLTPSGLCCGLTWITTGQLDTAKRLVAQTVAALLPQVEAGVPVVGLEPSCTAVLRSDALELLGTAAAEAVARGTRTLAELLLDTPGWTPPDLSGTRAVAQPHCHHHAVMGWDADERLLAAAGVDVQRLGGCCGLAGSFGAERGHYDVSVAVAEHALLPAVRDSAPGDVVLADGFSCHTQLADLAGVDAVHLAQLLRPHPA